MMFVIVLSCVCVCVCGTSQRCTTCNSVPLDLVVMADKAAVGYIAISVFQISAGYSFFFFRILVPKSLFYNRGKVALINHLYLQSF